MKLQSLREEVYEANMELTRRGLVLYTFGNVSGIDRNEGIIVIKPSGIPYSELNPNNMVLVDLDQCVVEGDFKPSSDTRTHLRMYKEWSTIGGIAHCHSRYATVWAQARRSIPCLGTTHADYANGDIPCSAAMTEAQVMRDYEDETGVQIIRALGGRSPQEIQMVLAAGHGPFAWGIDADKAVHHAVVLEELAHMATLTEMVSGGAGIKLEPFVLHKHYARKHGPGAYYGQ
jgi:L-ribulose-5-phosphate 4-epimerase